MNPVKAFVATLRTKSPEVKVHVNSIYDIGINGLNGNAIDLSHFKGKYLLIVNVASQCGFTPQYRQLEALYRQYNEKLHIIGVPCNQFGGQEPGDAETIASFCELNYGVSFTITEKIDVKGKYQHPLYAWLTQKVNNGVKNSSVKWNFQKYLIDPEGTYVDYYVSTTSPLSAKIVNHLK